MSDDDSLSDAALDRIPSRREASTLATIASQPAAWIIGTVTALTIETAARELQHRSAIELLMVEGLWRMLLLPLSNMIFESGEAVIDSIIVIFFGTDRSIGVSPGEQFGIADVPYEIMVQLADVASIVPMMLADMAEVVTGSLADGLVGLGIGAPFAVAISWSVTLAATGWFLWLIVSSIDWPLARVVPFLKTLTDPIMNVIRRLLT